MIVSILLLSAGPRGLDGDPGDDGVKGSPGSRGIPGKQGIAGRTGQPGKTGLRGPPGLPGLNGLPGRNGSDGLPGEMVLILSLLPCYIPICDNYRHIILPLGQYSWYSPISMNLSFLTQACSKLMLVWSQNKKGSLNYLHYTHTYPLFWNQMINLWCPQGLKNPSKMGDCRIKQT